MPVMQGKTPNDYGRFGSTRHLSVMSATIVAVGSKSMKCNRLLAPAQYADPIKIGRYIMHFYIEIRHLVGVALVVVILGILSGKLLGRWMSVGIGLSISLLFLR